MMCPFESKQMKDIYFILICVCVCVTRFAPICVCPRLLMLLTVSKPGVQTHQVHWENFLTMVIAFTVSMLL